MPQAEVESGALPRTNDPLKLTHMRKSGIKRGLTTIVLAKGHFDKTSRALATELVKQVAVPELLIP